MTADAESGMSRATDLAARKPVPATVRRWQRLRSAAIVLITQCALLAVLLGFWDYMTANNKQAAFMFGSPAAIAGFLGQMVKDGSLWRDSYVTGLETVARLSGRQFHRHRHRSVACGTRGSSPGWLNRS